MSATTWKNWLEPVKVISENEYEIILQVPNNFVDEYILKNYADVLKECMNNKEIKFEYRPYSPLQEKSLYIPESNESRFFKTVLKKYQQSSFENSKYLTQEFINFGKDWASNPKSLIVYGKYGRGKTYYCFCLIREAMRQNEISDALYLSSTELDSNLLNAIRSNSGDYKLLQEYKNVEVLLIDDFGRETDSDRMHRQLYDIINYRYSNEKTTLISTNFDIPYIEENICPAIASRMCEWEIIEMKGPDLRRII